MKPRMLLALFTAYSMWSSNFIFESKKTPRSLIVSTAVKTLPFNIYLNLNLKFLKLKIFSAFLGNIKQAFDKNSKLTNLLLDEFFAKAMKDCQASMRIAVSTALNLGLPTPAMSTALAFYDGFRAARLPANLLQAQRDYFGAHTYELLGQEGKFEHTNWTGHGGNVSASTYDA